MIWAPFPQTASDLSEVRRRLLAALDEGPEPIRRTGRELADSGGKGLRAGLLLLIGRAGAFSPRLYDLAAAVELLHLATLVHDDLVDQAPTRRGRPSLAAAQGPGRAVLYGDLFFAAAFDLASEAASPETARQLARLVRFMAGSEILQEEERFRVQVSPRQQRRKLIGKTAALFSLSCSAGAREGGLSPADQALYRRFGYHLGLAFQMQDDLLDYEGTAAELGKPAGHDLCRGLFTLPVHYALQAEAAAGEQAFAARLNDAAREAQSAQPAPGPSISHSVYQILVEDIRRWGGFDRARAEIAAQIAAAERCLDLLAGNSPAPHPLADLRRLLKILLPRRF